MDDVGCYIAFAEVRNVILIATGMLVVMTYCLARVWERRVRRRRSPEGYGQSGRLKVIAYAAEEQQS